MIVCKHIMAHGSTQAHKMCLIFDESSLADIEAPCVVQTFVNHNARLWKLFVIHDKYYMIERPSIKNFYTSTSTFQEETIHFDSSEISKPDCDSWLTRLDRQDHLSDEFVDRVPLPADMERIVKSLGTATGMHLFGVDIIIEATTGRYAIIDINVFPGYDGVDNFLQLLADLTVQLIDERRQTFAKPLQLILDQNVHHNHHEPDSGIDTSDSCDEKKSNNNLVVGPTRTKRISARGSQNGSQPPTASNQ